MIPVRQSTAFEIAVGPVLDADGVAVTGCVVADFKIKKTTGNFAALNGSATLTHVSAGVYDLVLTTSDVDTVGLATVAIDDTVNACASLYLQVMEEAVYDALYAASAAGYQVPIWAAANSTVSLSATTIATVTTTTTATNVTTVNGLAANVITAASMNADASAEIADAVWDEDATGHQTQGTFGQAIGDPVADTNTIFKAVVTDATGATVGVDVAAVLDDTGTAGVVVASLAAGSITASVIATGAIDADALAADAGTELGTAVWASATRTLTSLSGLTVDTVTTLTNLPAITANWLTAAGTAADFGAEIADAVWDEALAGHLTGGSTGNALNAAGSAGDPWSTSLPGAYSAGSAGYIIGTNLNATVTSRMATYTQPTGFLAATFPTTVGSSTVTTAQVNAEVVDALSTDTYTEPTGAPGATVSLAEKIGRLYQIQRNKVTVTASAMTFYSDTGTTLWSKALSDDNTTYVEAEGS